jgi:internalin A
METVTMPFPALWAQIKDHLAGMTENYLPLCDYRQLCAENRLKDKGQQDSLAETLHHLGIILHYPDDARLHDTTVLNPRWVTTSVYTLLRHVEKRQMESGKFTGHLTLTEARTALPKERPQMDREGKPLDMVAYLLGLMERFELCYPLENSNMREAIWLIPQLLAPQNPADLGDAWFRKAATRLRYEYNVLPEGLLPRFIVRAHPLVHHDQVWRQGVVLEMEDEKTRTPARALVIAEPARNRIEATIMGPVPARLRLTKLVRAHFEDIHSTFTRMEERKGKKVTVNNLDARELVELVAQPGHFQSVRTLVLDERNKNVSTIATEEEGSVRIDQSAELDRVASPKGKERGSELLRLISKNLDGGPPKVFVSYAHSDAGYRDVILQNLEVMEHDGIIDAWYDGKVLASQDFDKEIRRALNEADLIIFLISTASLRSKYIREIEVARALDRIAETADTESPVRVVPIVLEQDCAWKTGPLAHLQSLPGDRRGNLKAVDQWPNRRKAFNAIEQALRKTIEDG